MKNDHRWINGFLCISNPDPQSQRLDEEFIVSTFYTNQGVVDSPGQEMCIAIDVALAGSGCEAVVEGFYSVVGAHKKSVKQVSHRACDCRLVFTAPNPLSRNDENNCRHLF